MNIKTRLQNLEQAARPRRKIVVIKMWKPEEAALIPGLMRQRPQPRIIRLLASEDMTPEQIREHQTRLYRG